MNKPLCEVNNDLITIVVEEGIRTTKIRVWGCFHFGNEENKKILKTWKKEWIFITKR